MSTEARPQVWALNMIMEYTWGDHTHQDPVSEIYSTYEAAEARTKDLGRIARDYTCEGYLTDNGVPIIAKVLTWNITRTKVRGAKA